MKIVFIILYYDRLHSLVCNLNILLKTGLINLIPDAILLPLIEGIGQCAPEHNTKTLKNHATSNQQIDTKPPSLKEHLNLLAMEKENDVSSRHIHP